VADPDREHAVRIGLCATCQHSRLIQSAKGSEFWLCERSKSDARFSKYPVLPVRACLGYSRNDVAPR
jgi:hypothetical protein